MSILVTEFELNGNANISRKKNSLSNLSAYCTIDFRGVTDPKTDRVASAALSIADLRYGSKPLEASTQPPTYSPKDLPSGKMPKYTHTFFNLMDSKDGKEFTIKLKKFQLAVEKQDIKEFKRVLRTTITWKKEIIHI